MDKCPEETGDTVPAQRENIASGTSATICAFHTPACCNLRSISSVAEKVDLETRYKRQARLNILPKHTKRYFINGI